MIVSIINSSHWRTESNKQECSDIGILYVGLFKRLHVWVSHTNWMTMHLNKQIILLIGMI